MDPWHVAHLVSLSLWGGLVLAEGVVELTTRNDQDRAQAAKLHYWMDVLVEVPLLAAVLLTGAVLVARAWPPSMILLVKVCAGLTAVGVNAWCVGHVVMRYQHRDDAVLLRRHSSRVRAAGAIGGPFAAIAVLLGFTYFMR